MCKVFLFILHTSLFHIYVRPHQMLFFSKICFFIELNVPFHMKNASVKCQWRDLGWEDKLGTKHFYYVLNKPVQMCQYTECYLCK